MNAAPMSLHESDELGIAAVLDVVDTKAAVRVAFESSDTRLDFRIGEHQLIHHPHFVSVRVGMRGLYLTHHCGPARIGNIQDRGSVRPMLMADKGVGSLDHV